VQLLGDYLQFRKEIIGLVLIMDARHPLKELDIQMIEFFSMSGKPLHVVLSKDDKLSNQERVNTLRQVRQQISEYGFVNLSVQLFSSLKRTGIEELENKLNEWLE
jgi:GTP-binding protein